MIRDLRHKHYQQLAFGFILSSVLGWYLDAFWILLALLSSSYLLWALYQQHQLIGWLINSGQNPPPESIGLWGIIFDYLYRNKREHQLQIKHYRDIVQRFQSSTEALNDGILLLDHFGGIQWWNSAAKELLKLRKEDRGQVLTNLLRDPSFIKFYARSHHGEPVILENPAHTHHFLQISMTLFGKGERLLLLRDVSRLKQLEKMREDFVANASHELKTPLTVFKGHLENILEFNPDINPSIRKALITMNAQADRMSHLVSDLLLLTRLDSTKRTHIGQAIDIPNIINQMIEETENLARKKQQIIHFEGLTNVQIQGNLSDLRSAINNLIINAINYSPANSAIQITWQQVGTNAILSVADEGVGIEQHHIPRLTERFYRVDNGRSRDSGGTGLGLAIVKHILQLHDGRLDIRSEKNKGSVFSCIFPKKRILDPTETTSQNTA